MQKLSAFWICRLSVLLSVISAGPLSCASRPVAAPCPALPPRPQVVLPAPGELQRELEKILTFGQPSTSLSFDTKAFSPVADPY